MTAKKSRNTSSRHLRWEYLETLINAGPPLIVPFTGSPQVQLFIAPAGHRIGIRFSSRRGAAFSSPLAEVTIREISINGAPVLEVSANNADLYRDFYALCCLIADRVQVEKQGVVAAVTETLESWSALIRRRSFMSNERQIGLLGELYFLARAAKALGWKTAAEAWLGPNSEEHDFALPLADAEVKTTLREERIHHIGSLQQLMPKTPRPLYLISVQLTQAGAAVNTFSLPSMVASVLAAADAETSSAAEQIRNQLSLQGWQDNDASLYCARYVLRGAMTASHVSKDFPAITEKSLARLGSDLISRLQSVAYTINVEGLGITDGTRGFDKAIFRRARTK